MELGEWAQHVEAERERALATDSGLDIPSSSMDAPLDCIGERPCTYRAATDAKFITDYYRRGRAPESLSSYALLFCYLSSCHLCGRASGSARGLARHDEHTKHHAH